MICPKKQFWFKPWMLLLRINQSTKKQLPLLYRRCPAKCVRMQRLWTVQKYCQTETLIPKDWVLWQNQKVPELSINFKAVYVYTFQYNIIKILAKALKWFSLVSFYTCISEEQGLLRSILCTVWTLQCVLLICDPLWNGFPATSNILWDIKFQTVKHLPADQSDIAVVDKEQKRADRCDNPCWQQHLKRAQEAEDIPRTEWTTGKDMEGEVQCYG